MNLNQCRLTLYAKSNEVNERDPNDTLIGDRLIQDFGPTGWQEEGEEGEDKEDAEDASVATQPSLGDYEDEDDDNDADDEDEEEDEDKEEPGRKKLKLNQ